METSVRALFARYEAFFRRALAGEADVSGAAGAEAASFYAPAFVAATPAGVMAGENDARLGEIMAQGYARYRAIGTKDMRIRHIRFSPIDAHHGVAHVAWTATYARQGQADAVIDFEVHYLVQQLDGAPRIFGWVSGDEQALLEAHGIV